MAGMTIRDLRKSYGAIEVIHGIDADIADGEFVVLVGPSGCGKSTLLRMIAGLEGITSGRSQIGERVGEQPPPAERDIAMVFQNYALYPHKTVAANMGFALKLRGDGQGRDPAAGSSARPRSSGSRPTSTAIPDALSGGQRQRVAMGRAIVRDPQVFLFDEPLSNLDAKLRVQMRTEIRELHQRLATTTVYVTHDQIEAMTMADKIVVMQGGRIEQVGAPLDALRPARQHLRRGLHRLAVDEPARRGDVRARRRRASRCGGTPACADAPQALEDGAARDRRHPARAPRDRRRRACRRQHRGGRADRGRDATVRADSATQEVIAVAAATRRELRPGQALSGLRAAARKRAYLRHGDRPEARIA